MNIQTTLTAREIRQALFNVGDQEMTVRELRAALFALGNQDVPADLSLITPEVSDRLRTGEAAPEPAMREALFAMGHAGANGDTSHPMRPAWEAIRAYFDARPRT
jgi:hypothetical protein